MYSLRRTVLALILSLFALSLGASLQAAESNGIIAIPYEASNTLVIIDTNAKKMLVYSVSDRTGLLLKEVRTFDGALQAPNFFTPKGLSVTNEKKELEKIKVEN